MHCIPSLVGAATESAAGVDTAAPASVAGLPGLAASVSTRKGYPLAATAPPLGVGSSCVCSGYRSKHFGH